MYELRKSTQIIRQQVQSKQKEALLLQSIMKLWNYLTSLWHSKSTRGFKNQLIRKVQQRLSNNCKLWLQKIQYGSTYVCSQVGPCWQAGLLKAVLWKHSDACEVNRILHI